MPNYNDLYDEIKLVPTQHESIRNKYLGQLHEKTQRNIIAYYSGWLQGGRFAHTSPRDFHVDDNDKISFMATIHQMDRSKGLDLILHTPGGDIAATESLVEYLRSMFDDMRAIVPQLAMSAGTMIACACKSIVMGKQSSLGPIDPQYSGVSAHSIIAEFEQAKKEIAETPMLAHAWQPILAKYAPTLVGECQHAINWAESMVKDWLKTGMLAGQEDPDAAAQKVVDYLGSHEKTASHNRHISLQLAKNIGLTIETLEDDQDLQELVLSVHHAFIQTLADSATLKMVANHRGVTRVSSAIV